MFEPGTSTLSHSEEATHLHEPFSDHPCAATNKLIRNPKKKPDTLRHRKYLLCPSTGNLQQPRTCRTAATLVHLLLALHLDPPRQLGPAGQGK